MTDQKYHWVTVERFWSPTPALFLRSVLEGHGIPAFVRNEYLGGLFAHMTLQSVQGGVELQVPSDCVEAALTLLADFEADADEEDEDNLVEE